MCVEVHVNFLYSPQLHMQETTSPSSSLPGTKIRQRGMVRKDYSVDRKAHGHSRGALLGHTKASSAAAKLPICRRPEMVFL